MFSFAQLAASILNSKGLSAACVALVLLVGMPAADAQEAAASTETAEAAATSEVAPSTEVETGGSGDLPAPSEEAEPELKIERSDGDPQWLQKMLSRNDDLLPEVDVAAEDGFFQAKIAAELVAPVQLMEDFYLVTFRFTEEEQSFGECYVFQDSMDLAASLMLFSDNSFSWVSQSYSATIESKGVLAVDSGHIDGAPYLGLAWLYRMLVDGSQEPMAGQAKHWIARKEERAIYCQTSLLGHDQTFFDLFEGFVSSLEYQNSPSDPPYFEEVAVMRVNGQNLGVAWTHYYVDEDGDLERRESLSTLVPVDQQTLQSQDSLGLSYSDLDGELISEIHVEAENGEVVTNLRLAPDDDAGWAVTGTFQGKELEANLGPGAPRADFGQRLDFVEFMKTAQPDAVMTHQAWTPSMDPTRWDAVKVTYKEPHRDGFAVTLQSGPMKLDGVIDQDMNLERVVMDLGGASMSIEGVFEQGDVWYPKTLVDAAKTESSDAESSDAEAADSEASEDGAETSEESSSPDSAS